MNKRRRIDFQALQARGLQVISVNMCEAAMLTGIGKTKLYEYQGLGQLSYFYEGRTRLVFYEELQRFVRGLAAKHPGGSPAQPSCSCHLQASHVEPRRKRKPRQPTPLTNGPHQADLFA